MSIPSIILEIFIISFHENKKLDFKIKPNTTLNYSFLIKI